MTGGYNDGVKIYVAINNGGGWLDRHDGRRHIAETDWWHDPKASLLRNASAGDLFFVKREHPNDELFTCARLKRDYAEEAPKTAWSYTSEAYSTDSTYRQRAAGVLNIPVEQVTRASRIGLIALEELIWFPAEQRPSLEGINKFTVTGRKYTGSHPKYEYLLNLPAQHRNVTAGSEAIHVHTFRATEAQWAEILPLHTELASRFEKWLRDGNYQDIKREQGWVDVRFSRDNHGFIAELKICYCLNTRQAIREAIGQVLEYNHYSGRTPAEEWWIILDQQPTPNDAAYIGQLREQYLVPLHLGYETSLGTGEFLVLK